MSLYICPTAELWIRIRQLVCKDNCPQKVISHKPRRRKTFFYLFDYISQGLFIRVAAVKIMFICLQRKPTVLYVQEKL